MKTKKEVAFTLAEVLITIAIVGIVAAMTLPTLMKNVAERSNSETQANVAQKITKSMELMRVHGGLDRTYASTDEFVDELSKYLKITTRCNASNMSKCWPTKYVTTSTGETFDVSKATKGKNLQLKNNTTDNVGMILADGTALIMTYNQDADIIGDGDTVSPTFMDLPVGFGRTKHYAYTTSVTGPIDFVMDTNGFRGPNSETRDGKYYDIRSFKTAKFSDGCTGSKIDGLGCVTQISSYSALDTTKEENQKYDSKYKGSDNYWAGAKKACDDVGMSLPDGGTLKSIYNKGKSDPSLGLPTSGWWWSTSMSGGATNHAFVVDFGDGVPHLTYKGGNNQILCVGD